MRSIREAKFEYDAIKEVLDTDRESLTIPEQLEMQYRMCDLFREIRSIRNEQEIDNANAGFRKTPVNKNKKVCEAEMTDYRAFKHFIEKPDNANKYKKNTLYSWKRMLRDGKTPAAVYKILKFAGYTVKSERKWNRPPNKKK